MVRPNHRTCHGDGGCGDWEPLKPLGGWGIRGWGMIGMQTRRSPQYPVSPFAPLPGIGTIPRKSMARPQGING